MSQDRLEETLKSDVAPVKKIRKPRADKGQKRGAYKVKGKTSND